MKKNTFKSISFSNTAGFQPVFNVMFLPLGQIFC